MRRLHIYGIAAIALLGGITPSHATNEATQAQSLQSTKSAATGVILNSDYKPIAGASVNAGNNRTDRTNENGLFYIPNVQIGTKLSISATGYESVSFAWQGTSIKLVLLRNGEKIKPVEIVDDDDVVEAEEQLISSEQIQAAGSAFGSSTFNQGTDDISVAREHHDEVIIEEKKPARNTEQIFYTAEKAPSFPGGQQAMYEWMIKNIRYPETAARNNVQGKVILQFVIEKDGSIGEVKVARGRDKELDAESVRMVKTMPKFIPGRMNGMAVRTWFTLPVSFKLAEAK